MDGAMRGPGANSTGALLRAMPQDSDPEQPYLQEAAMPMPPRLSNYLQEHHADFELCPHLHSHSSAETARLAHVSPQQLAKSVMLEDDQGCVLAVVPADQRVALGTVARMLGRSSLHLSDEASIAARFDDCERGAVPAFGMAWGVETVVDDALERNAEVFIEAGDHEQLIRMSRAQFCTLMHEARHGRISHASTH
jgi:Ala-tRNA(Pro) deacylase